MKNRLWAWAAFGVPLALYVASLMPDVGFWDTGEMQTVPYILGIAHPTGFPMFVLSGWIFSHVLPLGNVAWRLSLMSALAMALTAYAVYVLSLRLGAQAPVACAAACLFAVGEVAWTRGTRTEVHAFAILFAMLAILNALEFYRTGARRALYALALWLGLGLATHPVVALGIPGCALFVFRRHALVFWKGAGLRACAIVLACLTLYLYMPLRSMYLYEHRVDPTLALGVPAGRAFWDNNHPAEWSGFKRQVSGEEFGAGGTLARLLMLQAYRDAFPVYMPSLLKQYGPFVLPFMAAGLLFIACDDLWLACSLIVAGGLAIPFAVSYRHVEVDIGRYFLTSYGVLIPCAAAGAGRAFKLCATRLRLPPQSASALAALTLLFAASQLFSVNSYIFRQREDYGARRWIERVRSATPPNALIVAVWPYSTPLAYAAYVEKSLQKRTIENAWVADDVKYLDGWLRRFPVYVAQDAAPELPGYRFTPVDQNAPSLYKLERWTQ